MAGPDNCASSSPLTWRDMGLLGQGDDCGSGDQERLEWWSWGLTDKSKLRFVVMDGVGRVVSKVAVVGSLEQLVTWIWASVPGLWLKTAFVCGDTWVTSSVTGSWTPQMEWPWMWRSSCCYWFNHTTCLLATTSRPVKIQARGLLWAIVLCTDICTATSSASWASLDLLSLISTALLGGGMLLLSGRLPGIWWWCYSPWDT